MACQILVIVGLTSALCVLLPFFNTTKGMNSALPKDKRDKMRIAKRIAQKDLITKLKSLQGATNVSTEDPSTEDPPTEDPPTENKD